MVARVTTDPDLLARQVLQAIIANPSLQIPVFKPAETFEAWRDRKTTEILAGCFPKQRAFIQDPHRGKAALCTRRAGKSYGVAAAHCIALLQGGNGAYIAPTAKQARRIMWHGRAGLKAVARRFKIDADSHPQYGVEFNNTELIVTCRGNQASVMLGGAETQDDCEKFRGEAYKLVTIDEPASFKAHLDYLLDEVLEPTLLDEDGTLALVGTPGRVLAGKFYEITSGQKGPPADDDVDEDVKLADWSVHHWSVFDNPYLKNATTFLARVFRRHGWNATDPPPRAQREYGGKWVRETETLCYPYADANLVDALPGGHEWRYVKGLDLGVMAIEVVAYAPTHPAVYFVEGWKKNVGLSSLADKMREFDWRYPNAPWMGDYGALGKQIIDEFNLRYKFGIRAAEKRDKAAYMEALAEDLRAGRAKVVRGNPILAEWDVLQWAEPTGDPKQDQKRQEHPGFENHLSDAGLYAWREAKHWCFVNPEPPVVYGTSEWFKAQEDALWQKAMERQKANQPGNWLEQGARQVMGWN